MDLRTETQRDTERDKPSSQKNKKKQTNKKLSVPSIKQSHCGHYFFFFLIRSGNNVLSPRNIKTGASVGIKLNLVQSNCVVVMACLISGAATDCVDETRRAAQVKEQRQINTE